MGLDQYARARKGEPKVVKEEYQYKPLDSDEWKTGHEERLEWEDSFDLADWRKHPNLQGWMEQLWLEKGGEGEFNCVELELTLEDLARLEAAVDGKDLPTTSGFFFGPVSDEHYEETDREFIASARKALKNGYTVVYSSWW